MKLEVGKRYVPQPQQPLRWVENCKPDKPGIWAYRGLDGVAVADILTEKDIVGCSPQTRCYLGPIPEILPPVKKVVERLWMEHLDAVSSTGSISPLTRATYEHHWLSDDAKADPSWIRTNRTREREI